MSNIDVSGTITANGELIAKKKELLDYGNFDTLYSTNSVATGNASITGKFSDYDMLIFGMYNSDSAGYITTAMPVQTFITLSSSNYGSLGIWVEQNFTNANRRACLLYVDDAHINVRYIQRANRLRIWGIKKYS